MAKKEKEVLNKKKGHYFKDMKAELKKVIWPTPKQLFKNTLSVIVFTLALAIIVFVLDLFFDSIYKYGVTPLQEKIQSSYNSTHEETTESEDESSDEEESEGDEVVVETDNSSTEVTVETEVESESDSE